MSVSVCICVYACALDRVHLLLHVFVLYQFVYDCMTVLERVYACVCAFIRSRV